jgi:hypothetical protein
MISAVITGYKYGLFITDVISNRYPIMGKANIALIIADTESMLTMH